MNCKLAMSMSVASQACDTEALVLFKTMKKVLMKNLFSGQMENIDSTDRLMGIRLQFGFFYLCVSE